MIHNTFNNQTSPDSKPELNNLEPKQMDFAVIKQKIIKTDEILQMYLETTYKLKKTAQGYKELQCKFDRLQLENERSLYTLESIKSKHDQLEIQHQELNNHTESLHKKYNQSLVDSQIHIRDLENELTMFKDLNSAKTPTPPKKNGNYSDSKKFDQMKQSLTKSKEAELQYKAENNKLHKDIANLKDQLSKNGDKEKKTISELEKEKAKILQDMQQLHLEMDKRVELHKQVCQRHERKIQNLKSSLSVNIDLKKRISFLEDENKMLKTDQLNNKKNMTRIKYVQTNTIKTVCVSTQTDKVLPQKISEETVLPDDIQTANLDDIFNVMIELPQVLSPCRSPLPDHIIDNAGPDIIVTPCTPVEENIENFPEDTATQNIPHKSPNENIPFRPKFPLRTKKKFLKRLVRKNRKILKKKFKSKTQDHILRALQILKKSKINFTISTEPTLSSNYNLLENCCSVPINNVSKDNLSRIECLNCKSKQCKKMYMLLNEAHLLGFLNDKKDFSQLHHTCANKSHSPPMWLHNKLPHDIASVNVLDKLAELVSEKMKSSWPKIHKREHSDYVSDSEPELERLFAKPHKDVLAANALIMKKLREESVVQESKADFTSEVSSDISLPCYLPNLSQLSSLTGVSSNSFNLDGDKKSVCLSRSQSEQSSSSGINDNNTLDCPDNSLVQNCSLNVTEHKTVNESLEATSPLKINHNLSLTSPKIENQTSVEHKDIKSENVFTEAPISSESLTYYENINVELQKTEKHEEDKDKDISIESVHLQDITEITPKLEEHDFYSSNQTNKLEHYLTTEISIDKEEDKTSNNEVSSKSPNFYGDKKPVCLSRSESQQSSSTTNDNDTLDCTDNNLVKNCTLDTTDPQTIIKPLEASSSDSRPHLEINHNLSLTSIKTDNQTSVKHMDVKSENLLTGAIISSESLEYFENIKLELQNTLQQSLEELTKSAYLKDTEIPPKLEDDDYYSSNQSTELEQYFRVVLSKDHFELDTGPDETTITEDSSIQDTTASAEGMILAGVTIKQELSDNYTPVLNLNYQFPVYTEEQSVIGKRENVDHTPLNEYNPLLPKSCHNEIPIESLENLSTSPKINKNTILPKCINIVEDTVLGNKEEEPLGNKASSMNDLEGTTINKFNQYSPLSDSLNVIIKDDMKNISVVSLSDNSLPSTSQSVPVFTTPNNKSNFITQRYIKNSPSIEAISNITVSDILAGVDEHNRLKLERKTLDCFNEYLAAEDNLSEMKQAGVVNISCLPVGNLDGENKVADGSNTESSPASPAYSTPSPLKKIKSEQIATKPPAVSEPRNISNNSIVAEDNKLTPRCISHIKSKTPVSLGSNLITQHISTDLGTNKSSTGFTKTPVKMKVQVATAHKLGAAESILELFGTPPSLLSPLSTCSSQAEELGIKLLPTNISSERSPTSKVMPSPAELSCTIKNKFLNIIQTKNVNVTKVVDSSSVSKDKSIQDLGLVKDINCQKEAPVTCSINKSSTACTTTDSSEAIDKNNLKCMKKEFVCITGKEDSMSNLSPKANAGINSFLKVQGTGPIEEDSFANTFKVNKSYSQSIKSYTGSSNEHEAAREIFANVEKHPQDSIKLTASDVLDYLSKIENTPASNNEVFSCPASPELCETYETDSVPKIIPLEKIKSENVETNTSVKDNIISSTPSNKPRERRRKTDPVLKISPVEKKGDSLTQSKQETDDTQIHRPKTRSCSDKVIDDGVVKSPVKCRIRKQRKSCTSKCCNSPNEAHFKSSKVLTRSKAKKIGHSSDTDTSIHEPKKTRKKLVKRSVSKRFISSDSDSSDNEACAKDLMDDKVTEKSNPQNPVQNNANLNNLLLNGTTLSRKKVKDRMSKRFISSDSDSSDNPASDKKLIDDKVTKKSLPQNRLENSLNINNLSPNGTKVIQRRRSKRFISSDSDNSAPDKELINDKVTEKSSPQNPVQDNSNLSNLLRNDTTSPVKKARGRPRKYPKKDLKNNLKPIVPVNKSEEQISEISNINNLKGSSDSESTSLNLHSKHDNALGPSKVDIAPSRAELPKTIKPVKKTSKLQSRVMRQMREKQQMLQKQPVYLNNANINCDDRLNNKQGDTPINTKHPAYTESSKNSPTSIKHPTNTELGKKSISRLHPGNTELGKKSISIQHPDNTGSSKKINVVQNILIPPHSGNPIDLLHHNKTHSGPTTVRKRVVRRKNNCDILSQILGEMDKGKQTEKAKITVIKRDIPAGIEEKQWRRRILDIAEITHNYKDNNMNGIYGFLPYKKKREGILKNGAPLPDKIQFLLNKLLKIPNESDIPEGIMLEFKRLPPDFIIDLVIYQVSRDINDKPEDKYYPAPLMTRTQRIFLSVLVKLEQVKGFENILELFFFKTQQFMFKTGCGIRAAIPLTRLFLSLCRLHANINRMRTFCCEAFFHVGDLAIPILFTVLTSWTEVFPLEPDVKNYPMTKILVQLVHLKSFNKAGYNLFPLKMLLSQYYGYPKERWDSEELFEEISHEYLNNPSLSSDYAIRLFCKNHDAKFVYKKLNEFFKPLIYKIPSHNVNFKAATIILMGKICRQFKPKVDVDVNCLTELKRWFEGLLEDSKEDLIKQSITHSLERLPSKGKPLNSHYIELGNQNGNLCKSQTKSEM